MDVVKSQGDPGEIRLYRRDEILKHAPGVRTSPHDPGVKEALLSLEFAGEDPEVLLVGVIPDKVEHARGMTDAVRAAIPAAEIGGARGAGPPGLSRRPRRDPGPNRTCGGRSPMGSTAIPWNGLENLWASSWWRCTAS